MKTQMSFELLNTWTEFSEVIFDVLWEKLNKNYQELSKELCGTIVIRRTCFLKKIEEIKKKKSCKKKKLKKISEEMNVKHCRNLWTNQWMNLWIYISRNLRSFIKFKLRKT